ncbi:hypothetical protein V6N11_056086 [Hibiscus sabdariffa]|uniref:Reverse transcriptase zinc-binding domain-containing protein n=1 Tax=Hibiscus sabdariffa TaxID=183260 RepID=A0ABR2T2T9_9ROSI
MAAEMVSVSSDWDWSRISSLLPLEIRDRIAAVQPPQVGLDADAPEWRWTDTRQFMSSSAYAFLSDMVSGSSDNFWQKVWALSIPQRVRTFLWITLHNRKLTNAKRFRRHLAPSAICDICGFHTEAMDHILRHCVAARGTWTRVICLELLVVFLQTPFEEWFKRNLVSTSGLPFILTKSLHWSRPPPGWIKGNVDASVDTANGLAAIGGVIRDEHGDWIVGFTRHVGRCSVLLAELWALHDMLARAQRTCNLLDDKLAAWGRLNSQDVLTLPSPPSSLLVVVEADKNSTRLDPLELQDWYGNVDAVCFALRVDHVEEELLEMVSAGSEPVGIG